MAKMMMMVVVVVVVLPHVILQPCYITHMDLCADFLLRSLCKFTIELDSRT